MEMECSSHSSLHHYELPSKRERINEWSGTHMFCFFLNIHNISIFPTIHGLQNILVHVCSDLNFEPGGLEEGPYKPMHSPLQTPTYEQYWRLPHQLPQRLRIARHKRPRITLQYYPAHLPIRRYYSGTPEYVWSKHFPIPASRVFVRA